jgi:hypothetical protein
MAKPKTYKLDLFKALNSLATHKLDSYSKFTDEEKKGFAPSVLMRWMSASQANSDYQKYYLCKMNQVVNKHLWTLSSKHPELLWKLMASCGLGEQHRFEFIKKDSKKDQHLNYLAKVYPNAKIDDLKDQIRIFGKEHVIQIAIDRGEEKDIIKKLKDNV